MVNLSKLWRKIAGVITFSFKSSRESKLFIYRMSEAIYSLMAEYGMILG